MIEAVRKARAAGVRTGLITNSWGAHRYPHELFEELFDGIVISGEEGMRKPSRRMYELGAERAGLRAGGVRLRGRPALQSPARGEAGDGRRCTTPTPETTVPELERLLGIPLALTASKLSSRLPRPYSNLRSARAAACPRRL